MKRLIQGITLAWIIATTALSCYNPSSIKFDIINASSDIISNVRISINDSHKKDTIQLNDNKSTSYILNMSNISRQDGSYQIEFDRNKETERVNFGYYTNGYPINSKYLIEITKDSISIQEE